MLLKTDYTLQPSFISAVTYLGFLFGRVQNFSGKVGLFAWRSHAFARGSGVSRISFRGGGVQKFFWKIGGI